MTLTLLLQNLFNAPWPKTFNAEGFTTPNMESIQNSNDISILPWDDQKDMANALVTENEDMFGTPFHSCYISPIKRELARPHIKPIII